MNILILTHSWPDEKNSWRGSFVREQAVALSTEHNVSVVYFRTDKDKFSPFGRPSVSETRSGKLVVHTFTVPRSFPAFNQLRYLNQTFKFIREEILRESGIDLIHSHLSFPAGVLGVWLQKRVGIPCLITEHSFIKKYFRSSIHKRLVLYALGNCKMIIPVSEALGADIRKWTSNRMTVIPNVVACGKFSISERSRTGEVCLGILGGYNDNIKGLDLLIKAIKEIGKPEYKVYVGGDGMILEEIKKSANDNGVGNNFIFLGTIRPESLQEFYNKLDIFVLPSRHETFGLVLAEAMSCGIPVIATRCGGPEEIITKGTGVLVPVEDPKALASAITEVAANLDSFDRNAIRTSIVKRYGSDRFISEIQKVYSICQRG